MTLSSLSKITGSEDSESKQEEPHPHHHHHRHHKPLDDDYLVVDEELMGRSDTERDSSMAYSSPSPTPPSLHTPPPPPLAPPPIPTRTSPSPPQEGKAPLDTKLYGLSPTVKIRYATGIGGGNTESPVVSFEGNYEIAQEALLANEVPFTTADKQEKVIPKSYAEAEKVFRRKYSDHFTALMTQLIKSYGLSMSWLDVIRPLIVKATQTVRTDVFTDDIMNINEYVRVKKIPCGAKSNSSLYHGVVCTKNVTHKKMCTEIINPTILLLKCAFDFQRRENQLSSFDTLHLQENKYLQNLVDKVKAFRPSIILVQKSVSRLALEDLYNLGVVVVVNVKPTVMARVARCTQGEILTSLDKLFFDVRLGRCGKFYLRNFTLDSGIKKTLMYFDRCEPKLGCVVTLQGGTNRELKKVKRVLQFGLHLAYNSLLESTFLLDEYAWPSSSSGSGGGGDGGGNEGGGANEEGIPPQSFPYSSTCSTPEFPLYPSLPHPLDALPPAEIIKRLEVLGLNRNEGAGEPLSSSQPNEDDIGESGEPGESCKTPQSSDGVRKDESSAGEVTKDAASDQNLEPNSSLGKQSDSHSTTTITTMDSDSSSRLSDSHVSGEDSASKSTPTIVVAESDSHSTTSTDPGSHSTNTEDIKPNSIPPVVAVPDPNWDPETQLNAVDKQVLAHLGVKEFESAINNQLISISPNVKFSVPYLQTPQGREADIRQYLPSMIYWSYRFKPISPPKSRRSLNGASVNNGRQASDDPLEMGLTRGLVKDMTPPTTTTTTEGGGVAKRASTQQGSCIHHQMTVTTLLNKPSYKSVSEHPLTSSLLLLKANTNEMRAALADFRSRAGLSMEDNAFFFKSAKVAADYRLHLQNVFNKYGSKWVPY